MKVFGWATDDRKNWTAPFPTAFIGIKLRLLGGDMVSPDIPSGVLRPGREGEKKNFFNVIPTKITIKFWKRPSLPFLSFGFGWWGFYVGHKVFGMDSPAYLDYPGIKPEDVYEGSQALSGSTIRFTTKRKYS